MPNRFYPVDIEYDQAEEHSMEIDSNQPSKLAKPVQDLIKMIFDVNTMKQVMLEFEVS